MDWARRLRLNHLQLLINLNETGNLSETARIAHTTQPGLSKWLKDLESEIGTALFERHSRGLTPTPSGLLLVSHARRILTEMSRAEKNLSAIQDGSSGTFAIGTSPASAPEFVPTAILKFLEHHPKAKVELQENTTNTMLDQLELGNLDVVVGRLDNYQPRPTLRSELLYDEPLNIVARPGHPLEKRKNLTWDDLYEYDWIVWPPGTPIRSKLDNALTLAGRTAPPYRIESTSHVGNLWLLHYSDMLSVVSQRVAQHFNGRGLVIPLDIKIESADGFVGMCWREEAESDGALLDLLDSFRQSLET